MLSIIVPKPLYIGKELWLHVYIACTNIVITYNSRTFSYVISHPALGFFY